MVGFYDLISIQGNYTSSRILTEFYCFVAENESSQVAANDSQLLPQQVVNETDKEIEGSRPSSNEDIDGKANPLSNEDSSLPDR